MTAGSCPGSKRLVGRNASKPWNEQIQNLKKRKKTFGQGTKVEASSQCGRKLLEADGRRFSYLVGTLELPLHCLQTVFSCGFRLRNKTCHLMQMQIVQDLAHFFSGQLLFQSIAGEVSNLRGLLFSIGKEKMDNLHPPFFPLQRCAKCCFSNTVWEKENGRPSCCHLSARKKTRDNHDFNPQSSCLMPQASCTANRAFSLWRINVRTNVMSRNSWPWVRHTLIHGWINPAMGEILQDHLRKKKRSAMSKHAIRLSQWTTEVGCSLHVLHAHRLASMQMQDKNATSASPLFLENVFLNQ